MTYIKKAVKKFDFLLKISRVKLLYYLIFYIIMNQNLKTVENSTTTTQKKGFAQSTISLLTGIAFATSVLCTDVNANNVATTSADTNVATDVNTSNTTITSNIEIDRNGIVTYIDVEGKKQTIDMNNIMKIANSEVPLKRYESDERTILEKWGIPGLAGVGALIFCGKCVTGWGVSTTFSKLVSAAVVVVGVKVAQEIFYAMYKSGDFVLKQQEVSSDYRDALN